MNLYYRDGSLYTLHRALNFNAAKGEAYTMEYRPHAPTRQSRVRLYTAVRLSELNARVEAKKAPQSKVAVREVKKEIAAFLRDRSDLIESIYDHAGRSERLQQLIKVLDDHGLLQPCEVREAQRILGELGRTNEARR